MSKWGVGKQRSVAMTGIEKTNNLSLPEQKVTLKPHFKILNKTNAWQNTPPSVFFLILGISGRCHTPLLLAGEF